MEMHPSVQQIQHVVVLMLENRSFDHMLGALPAQQGYADCDGAGPARSNVIEPGGRPYPQTARSNFRLPLAFDPKHEFANVQTQLGAAIDMSGFAHDALTTARSLEGFSDQSPEQQQALVQTVMDYFCWGDLPGLHGLAQAFTVCDRWHASVPGPTWPNRFFAMMGSCHGRMLMPDGPLGGLTAVRSIGAQLGKNSIFSVLPGGMHQIYSDYLVPLSVLLKGASPRASMNQFKSDVAANKLPAFSWVEPNYSSNLAKANSQHPPEDARRGDALIADVYNTLRANEQVWKNSLLVVLYDEHGGFYDHVQPGSTRPPDSDQADVNFDFKRLGVRVPAVLVSPWIKPGVLKMGGGKPVYDHTSLLAFLCDKFGQSQKKPLLGQRVAKALHFGTADIWLDAPRTDTPKTLISPLPPAVADETISDALNSALPNLVAGLHAQASTQLKNGALGAPMPGGAHAQAAQQNILDAWNKGLDGRTDDEVADMVAQIKATFGGDSPVN